MADITVSISLLNEQQTWLYPNLSAQSVRENALSDTVAEKLTREM
jgi:hypothetical protein